MSAERGKRPRTRPSEVRFRVCRNCVTTADFIFGGVHSELPCDRCGKKPCEGAIVGATPWASGIGQQRFV